MTRRKRMVWPLLALMILISIPALAQQATTGAVTGRALDTTGALIPGVEVNISSPAMIEGSRMAVTDEQGSYRFALLPPGTYTVAFGLPGFKTLNVEGVIVPVGGTMTIHGTLEVATVAETITVTSQAPMIDLQDATKSINWSQQALENLPYGRAVRGLEQMLPGFQTNNFDVGGNTKGGPAGLGARSYGRSGGNVVTYDGVVWDQTFGDYGAFEEVEIITAAKGAESMNPGATVNFVIKSGGNDVHGTTYMDWQDDSFGSDNINDDLLAQGLTPSSNSFTRFNEFNFDIGGPIVRDKFWFYSAYGDMYSGLLVPGFISVATGEPATFFTSLKTPTLKLTWQLNDAMKLETHTSWNRKWQPYRNASELTPLEATHDQLSWTGTGPTLKWTYIVNPSMSTELAINRAGYYWPSGANTTDVRRIDRNTGQTRGAYNRRYRRPIRWQWNGAVSVFRDIGGKANEIKTGFLGYWNKNFTEQIGFPNQQVYRYRSTDAEADAGMYFLRPNSVQIYDLPVMFSDVERYFSWYVNDKITVNRHLTLNVGLRFDRYASWLPEQGNPGSGPFATQTTWAADHEFPVYNSWVPRFSAVYDVTGEGRLVFKLSYGRYTGGDSGSGTSPARGARDVNPADDTRWTYDWDGTIPFLPDLGPDGIFGTGDDPELQSVNGPAGSTGGSQRLLDSNLDNPYMDEYTAGIELGFNRDTTFRFNIVRKLDYGGSKLINLALPFEAYTDVRYGVDPGRDNIVGTSDDGVIEAWSVPRSHPGFGRVNQIYTQLDENEGNSLYTSYEATLNKQHADGWSLLASYQADFAKIGRNYAQNPNELIYGPGVSTRQGRRRSLVPNWNYAIRFHGQYDLPAGLMYSASYRIQSGEHYGRETLMRNALNSNVTIQTEQQAGRFDWVRLLDQRVSKTFELNDRHSVEAMFDMFNSLNSSAVLTRVTRNGSSYLKPLSTGAGATVSQPILPPRIFRLAIRWKF